MRIHRPDENTTFIGGTFSEISLEHFFRKVDLNTIFNIRKNEVITDIYITDFGIKARFEFIERDEK